MGKLIAGKRGLQKRHRDAITYALDQIKESDLGPYVVDVLLYGSCARGEQEWTSDVDLFVILSDDVRQLEGYDEKIIMLKGGASDPDMDAAEADVRYVIGSGWEDSSRAYHQNVQRDGISVWR